MSFIRQCSYVFQRRVHCFNSVRYQSSTTNDSINNSPLNNNKKQTFNSASWATSDTNDLVKQLSIRIKSGGPITIADFMREALLNPKYGYYTRHEVFGTKGDFITAPEISQIFGELLAVWIMYEHASNDKKPMQLVELGPGRGTLMNDIIRVLEKRNYSNADTFIALYEASALMRKRQAETLLGQSIDPLINTDYRIPNGNYLLKWIDDLKQLSTHNTYFIANELFDTYPIHKFQKTVQGWKEVVIDWNPTTKQLQYVLSLRQTTMSRLYQNFLSNIHDRKHVEISPQRSVMMQNICTHIKTHGGSALIGDYGHWGEKEDTFRGFRKHEVVDALSDPGNIDITADVDFEELALSGSQISNVHFYGPISQRNFLYNLGIDVRATILARDKTPVQQKEILSAVEKLVSPNYMGDRFLYICVQHQHNKNAPMPSHFINEINTCVDESLIGYVRTHNHLELLGRAVIVRSQIPSVAVISGNGSGHEPAMVGYVGRGLLSASISGSIFASPPAADIFHLIVEMKRRGAKQILLIILNYTGDRLNFGLAMERARELFIDVDMLVIADDAAVDSAIGPRGLAGALLVIKIAGALAEQNKSMSEIIDICQNVRAHLRTIGLSTSGVHPPGQKKAFELLNDEIELGMGIHGEIGTQRLKLISSRQAIEAAFSQLFLGARAIDIKRDDNVLLCVNNLGGCSNLELGIIIKDAIENLEHRSIHVKRVISGNLITSLDMKGFSLTVLKLTTNMSSNNILNLIDFPTDAYAWPKAISPTQPSSYIQTLPDAIELSDQWNSELVLDKSNLIFEPSIIELVNQAIQAVIKKLNSETDILNQLDAISGDGDTGTAFVRAADKMAQDLANGKLSYDRPSLLFRRLGLIAESRMGGTCGAICGLFFAAVAKSLVAATQSSSLIENFSHALEAGIQSVESYARVQPGDKSLLDALIPAVDLIKSKCTEQEFTSEDWQELVAVAKKAVEETKNLVAKVGRASYTKSVDIPVIDPGAHAVYIILKAISEIFIARKIH